MLVSFSRSCSTASDYASFISAFDFVNIQLVSVTGAQCVANINFYTEYLISAFTLAVLDLSLALAPRSGVDSAGDRGVPAAVLPVPAVRAPAAARARPQNASSLSRWLMLSMSSDLDSADDMRLARRLVIRGFQKLVYVAAFLLYPRVSTEVLRLYVCTEVEGVSYLVCKLCVCAAKINCVA